MLAAIIVEAREKNQSEDESGFEVYESDDHVTITSSANTSQDVFTVVESEITSFSRNLTENEKYMLAKIAMAEAEGESFDTKILVILTILNRVESNKFPDTIEEVIFQEYKGVYQFSPVMPGGRWWRVEPNKECWNAVNTVNSMEYDVSKGALYFEACSGESWHSKNLEFICKSNNTRFYK